MASETMTTRADPHGSAPTSGPLEWDELKMAYRCPAMPLESLRLPVTPIGQHYQVIHWEIPSVDPAAWELVIGGHVDRPRTVDLDALRRKPAVTSRVTLECAGNGRGLLEPRPVSAPWLGGAVSTAEWTGTPLGPLLRSAGPSEGAVDVRFGAVDRGIQGGIEQSFERALPIDEAMLDDVLLAYEMNGAPIPSQHGAPVRLVVPGWYGMASVKWLTSIEVLDHRYDGFQNRVAYRYQRDADDPGEPVARMRVKSLMAPPGIAEFITEQRVVDAGPVPISGRAWSGSGVISKVEFGVDGEWMHATLERGNDAIAWRGWTAQWDAAPGEYELTCRATDVTGATQPLVPEWNYQGMGNNAVQRIKVLVR